MSWADCRQFGFDPANSHQQSPACQRLRSNMVDDLTVKSYIVYDLTNEARRWGAAVRPGQILRRGAIRRAIRRWARIGPPFRWRVASSTSSRPQQPRRWLAKA